VHELVKVSGHPVSQEGSAWQGLQRARFLPRLTDRLALLAAQDVAAAATQGQLATTQSASADSSGGPRACQYSLHAWMTRACTSENTCIVQGQV
jgi:hypothetical protein